MANIQETLNPLQPYLIGIRYLEGLVAVDVVFKEGWVVPDDNYVKKEKGTDGMNYYMLYSDVPNIGIDEILLYVEKVIKLNLEKEKKHELLRAKVDELKVLFSKNPLSKLKNLRFTFEEILVPDINDFNLDIEDESTNEILPKTYEEEIIKQEETKTPTVYLDENHNPIELSEDEKEMLEEEARAERNRLMVKNKKTTQTTKKTNIELPPRKVQKEFVEQIPLNSNQCECGPSEACNKCIDTKY